MAELNNQSLAAVYEQMLADQQASATNFATQRAAQYQSALASRQQQQLAEAERQRQQQEAAAAAAAEAERTRGRTVGEFAADTGLATAQTFTGLAGAVYGGANVLTGGLLDRDLGFSQNLQGMQQMLEAQKSAPFQARKERAAQAFERSGLAAGAGEYLTNPSLLFDLGVQSAAYLIPGAAAARVAGGIAAARAAASNLPKAAQALAAQQAATRASLVSQGALTGGYLNPEAINAARKAGLSEGEQQLYGLGAAAVGAITNPLISKFTGAAGLEARAANALFGGASMPAQAGSAAARVGAFTTTQAVEEAAQEANERAIVNVAGQRPIGEGVGESAVLGGILGGVLGGVMGLTQIRQPSATRQELADLQAAVETELAGETGAPVVRPSLIRQAALQDAQNKLAASEQARVHPLAQREEIDVDATPLPASMEEIDLGATPVPVPVEEIDVGAAVDPGLTGLNRVVAEQRAALAQQPPRPLVQELPVEAIDITQEPVPPAPPAPVSRPLADIIRETAPIERVAEQFGPAVAGAEQARRMAAQPPTSVEAPAAPLDLSTPKAVGEYRRSVKQELARATGRDVGAVKGPQFDALVTKLADAGVRPGTPEFNTLVGVETARQLQAVERGGKTNNLLGALNNAYPVTQEQQLDAAFDRGGVPTTEEELFGAMPEQQAPQRPAFVDTPAAQVETVEREQQWVSPQGEVYTVAAMFNGRPQLQGPRGNRVTKAKAAMEREGWSLRQPAAQAAQAAAPKPQRDLTVKEQIADLGGILTSYRQDITGDTKASTAEAAPGRGRIFSENGTSPDDMAMQLAERNFVPAEELARDGGVQWLYDAVNRSLAGDKIYAQGSAAQERQFDEQMAEQAAQPEQSADAANPKQVTAAPPRYDARKWADYLTYPGAAQLNAWTNAKEREGNPQSVLAAMLTAIDLSGDMTEFAQVSNAAQAHPEFALMPQDARSQVSTHMATALNRLTGATFELGSVKKTVEAPHTARGENLDPLPAEAVAVATALAGKTAVQAAEWLAANAPKELRTVAVRTAAAIRALEAKGAKFTFAVTQPGRQINYKVRGIASSRLDKNGAMSVDVLLNGPHVEGYVGTSYQTALHELVHAATMVSIQLGNTRAAEGTKLASDVAALNDVFNATVRAFNARAKSGNMTEFESAMFNRLNNAMADPKEMVAWALTSKPMQDWLETVPYKGGNLWTEFVATVRKILGLPASADTALSEVLRVSDQLLSSTTDVEAALNKLSGAPTTTAQAQVSTSQPDAELQRALAMSEDDYIAAINPSGKTSAEDDIVLVRVGDLERPAGSQQITSFTDNQGGQVTVFADDIGTLYAEQDGQVVGQIESRDGETLNIVAQEVQGRGIGKGLAKELIKREPFAQAGSLSPAGEATRRAAFRELKAEQSATIKQSETKQQLAARLESEHEGLRLDLVGREPRIILSRIELPKSNRQQGSGTKIMREITAWADSSGSTISLSPSADFGGNKKRLVEFYKRFGFIENKGKNRDFEISEAMYRPATQTLSQSTGGATRGTFDPTNPDIRFSQGAVDTGMNKRLFDKGVETAARNYGRPIFGFDTVAQLEEQLGFPLPEGMKGVYLNGEIYVVRENIANGKELTFTVAHEVGHRGLEALLGSSLKAATNRMWANADMRKRIRAKMAELNMAQGTEEERRASRTLAAEEVLADMLAGNERLNKDIWSKLRAGVREFLARVFGIRNYVVTNKEVDDLLTDVARVIKGAPAAQVREKMQNPGLWINDAAQAAEADPKFSKAKADMDEMLAAGAREGASNVQPFSVAGKALANASINAAKSVWTAVKENKIGGLFTHNLMSLDQMVEWHDKLFRLPGAKTGLLSKVYDLKSNREAEFNRHIGAQRAHQYNTVKDGEPVTTDLGKFSVHDMIGEWDDYKRKNPAKAALLDHVNSEGTFYKVFPDRKWEDQVVEGFDYTDAGYTEEDRKQAWLRVSRAYNALDAQGKTIYQRAQSVYSQMSADRFAAIKAETDRLGKRAEAAAVAAGVDPAKVSARVAAAQDRYKKQIDAIIGRIKQGPYSPLMRFGDYVVTVRDEAGNVVHFSAHESVAERDAAAAEIGEQPDGYVVSTSMTRDQALEDAGVQRSEVEAIRSEVMALLPDDMDPEIRDSAMAAITAGLAEAYLQSLPAKSFAKHGLGRKNVAGYDTNSLRAFSNYTIRGARSIAGIKYDGQIGNAMLEIDQYVRDVARGKYADGEGVKRVDATKLQGVANAVKRQHMAALRMDNNKLSNALTTAAFTYQLTSPSQLLFNATQTPMVAFPRLSGIYGGGRAAKAISKALRDYTASGLDLLRTDTDAAGRAKSVLRNPTNPADAKVLEALQQIKDDGPLDITQAHDVSGIADGSAGELHPYWGKVMMGLSYFMHKSEVFNRQITALAAVRLELEKQMSSGADLNDPALVAELVRTGKRAIDTTQFNFAKFAKPPAMQGPIGKVVLQYRLYQLNTLSTLARDIRDGLFGSDPETKRIARETLAWTMGMQLAFMGTAGTILAPLVFAIADMFRDDDDLTTSRQAYVAAVGKFAAHGAAAGFLDMGRAEAASLFPILGQGAYAPVDGKPGDTFSYYITQNLGPSFGLAKNLYTGMANVADGDFEKAFQNLMPKPLADAHKAVYDGINGVRNAQDVVYHELSPWGAATQFLGFRSGGRRELEGQRSAFYTANANKFKVRDRYLAKLALGTGTGDRSLIDEAMEGIQAWNARYPDPQFMIKRQDIARAITRRQNQQRVAAETGLVSSRPISPVFDAVLGR